VNCGCRWVTCVVEILASLGVEIRRPCSHMTTTCSHYRLGLLIDNAFVVTSSWNRSFLRISTWPRLIILRIHVLSMDDNVAVNVGSWDNILRDWLSGRSVIKSLGSKLVERCTGICYVIVRVVDGTFWYQFFRVIIETRMVTWLLVGMRLDRAMLEVMGFSAFVSCSCSAIHLLKDFHLCFSVIVFQNAFILIERSLFNCVLGTLFTRVEIRTLFSKICLRSVSERSIRRLGISFRVEFSISTKSLYFWLHNLIVFFLHFHKFLVSFWIYYY